jgi:polyisoprenoid-binding protein YceI
MTTWLIDTVHSMVQFSVRYLVISTVSGYFTRFDARIDAENEDFTNAKIIFFAEADSITTNNIERDKHLKSVDFFSADIYPRISFRSTAFEKVSDTNYKLIGEMTIRNYVKTMELEVEFGGTESDMQGVLRAGFDISGSISRKEFGLLWDAVTETGSIMVGDEVKLNINAQFKKIENIAKS